MARPGPSFLDDFEDMATMRIADQNWLFVDNEAEALRRVRLRRVAEKSFTPSIRGAVANRAGEAARLAAQHRSPIERARQFLQRRGFIVYGDWVVGGRVDQWVISGHGRCNSDADLIALATSKGWRA